jgi:phospholipase/carboxylesterase
MDPSIPFAMGEQGRAALRAAGAELETGDYPIGHGISPDEATDIRAWLARALAAGA